MLETARRQQVAVRDGRRRHQAAGTRPFILQSRQPQGIVGGRTEHGPGPRKKHVERTLQADPVDHRRAPGCAGPSTSFGRSTSNGPSRGLPGQISWSYSNDRVGLIGQGVRLRPRARWHERSVELPSQASRSVAPLPVLRSSTANDVRCLGPTRPSCHLAQRSRAVWRSRRSGGTSTDEATDAGDSLIDQAGRFSTGTVGVLAVEPNWAIFDVRRHTPHHPAM